MKVARLSARIPDNHTNDSGIYVRAQVARVYGDNCARRYSAI